MIAAFFLAQTLAISDLPPKFQTQVNKLIAIGADVRVERERPDPIEVWMDFDKPLKNADLKLIAGLEPLTALRIMGGGYGDAGLAELKNLPRLWLLVLISDKITDAGMATVCKIPTLRKLDFNRCGFSAKGTRHLAKLKNLRELYLYNATLTANAYEPLKGLKQLQELDLPHDAPDKALAELKQALPDARVERGP